MKFNRIVLAGVAVAAICLAGQDLMAQQDQGGQGGQNRAQRGGGQGGGQFNMAEFQQRRLDAYKERLEVTDETEWTAMKPLVEKVMTAQTEVMADRARGMFGRGGAGGGRGGDAAGQGGGNRRGGFGATSTESEALQRAVDSKASAADLKAALAKYRDAHKAKQDKLDQAEAELTKVLSVRQESLAVLAGLIQ